MLYPSYEQVVARDQPIHWYRFGPDVTNGIWAGRPGQFASNTLSPGSTTPYGGPGLPGAAVGASTFTTGTSTSSAAQGWGVGAAVALGDGSTAAGRGVTMEAWFQLRSFTAGRTYGLFFRAYLSSAGFFSTSRDLLFYVTNGGASRFIASNVLNLGDWVHGVAIFRSGDNQFWVNGRRIEDVGAGTPAAATPVDITAQNRNFVGCGGTPTGTYSFPGFIAEPAIYTYALSPQQIVEHYQAGIMPRQRKSTLAAFGYPFPQTSPTSGLTPIGAGLPNRRVLMVSDRPR